VSNDPKKPLDPTPTQTPDLLQRDLNLDRRNGRTPTFEELRAPAGLDAATTTPGVPGPFARPASAPAGDLPRQPKHFELAPGARPPAPASAPRAAPVPPGLTTRAPGVVTVPMPGGQTSGAPAARVDGAPPRPAAQAPMRAAPVRQAASPHDETLPTQPMRRPVEPQGTGAFGPATAAAPAPGGVEGASRRAPPPAPTAWAARHELPGVDGAPPAAALAPSPRAAAQRAPPPAPDDGPAPARSPGAPTAALAPPPRAAAQRAPPPAPDDGPALHRHEPPLAAPTSTEDLPSLPSHLLVTQPGGTTPVAKPAGARAARPAAPAESLAQALALPTPTAVALEASAPEAATPDAEVVAAPASLWRRVLAWLTDLAVILGVVSGFFGAALAVIGAPTPAVLVSVALPAVGVVSFVAFVYTTLFAFLWRGRTPGRLLLGIHLVDATGQAPHAGRALVRAALSLASFGLFLSGFWLALFDRKGQTLHDKLTSTFVVRLKPAH
jgi:uncharacterized RDD family membrane protein YckC